MAARTRGFIPARDDKERLVMKRAEELAVRAVTRNIPCYSDYLSDREQDLCAAALNRAHISCYEFRGGYALAERKILCVEPPDTWQEQPWECLRVTHKALGGQILQHKDYLGAMMGLGIDRRCLGDICFAEDLPECTYIFVMAEKADYLCREFVQAGRTAVTVQKCEALPEQLNCPVERELKTATVPSLRLDTVLAALLGCSRSLASEQIAAGRVEVNHILMESPHAEVFEADVFTVRGKGRFKLEQIGGKSRKDRIFISFFQY